MSSFLDKYNPKTSIFSNFEVDASLPKEEKAFATWKVLLSAKRNSDGLFLIIGKLLKDIRDEKLYLVLDYDNFSQFLESEELSFSREKAYMCIRTFEYYIEYLELDPERIGSISISRLSMMVPMLKKIEDKTEQVKKIEEMTFLRHGDFVKEVKSKTNKNGKPTVYWSDSLGKWYVGYYSNNCHLHDLGEYENKH